MIWAMQVSQPWQEALTEVSPGAACQIPAAQRLELQSTALPDCGWGLRPSGCLPKLDAADCPAALACPASRDATSAATGLLLQLSAGTSGTSVPGAKLSPRELRGCRALRCLQVSGKRPCMEADQGFPSGEMLLQPCQGHKVGRRYSRLFTVAGSTLRCAALHLKTVGATTVWVCLLLAFGKKNKAFIHV